MSTTSSILSPVGESGATGSAPAPITSRRFTFKPVLVPNWPMLAWLARCERTTGTVTVYHGSRVEIADEWFGEVAWAGDFRAGDLDRTDVVAGSGARLRDDEVVFVSAGSTVDRLHSLETPDAAWVSNSLTCLMAALKARIEHRSAKYFWIFRTVVGGLQRYRRSFPTSAGNIQFTYFDNLVWNGRTLQVRRKPGMGRDFSTFQRYSDFLDSSMALLAANAADPARKYQYELLSTASSGYDSSTVTVLAHKAGATKVLCFDQARRGADDSGQPLAQCLGMESLVVPRNDWMTSHAMPEPPFIAADSHGGDVFFRGAEAALRGKVLLTGYHGDKMWAKHSESADENIVRGDQSGLSLTEYRLMIGMLHCPVSFWGVRQIADIHHVSTAAEMAPWDVPGDYSRPICRRIVESAGVPRELFGQEKRATWVLLAWTNEFLSPGSMQDYLGWLDEHGSEFLKRGRVPPLLVRRFDRYDVAVRKAISKAAADDTLWHTRAMKSTGLIRIAWRVGEKPSYLRRYLFPWALERHLAAYPPAF